MRPRGLARLLFNLFVLGEMVPIAPLLKARKGTTGCLVMELPVFEPPFLGRLPAMVQNVILRRRQGGHGLRRVVPDVARVRPGGRAFRERGKSDAVGVGGAGLADRKKHPAEGRVAFARMECYNFTSPRRVDGGYERQMRIQKQNKS